MMVVTDIHGRIIGVTPGVSDLFRIDERWLNGKPLAAFVVEDRRREFRTMLLALAHGGESAETTLVLRPRGSAGGTLEAKVEVEAKGDRLQWTIVEAVEAEPPAQPNGVPSSVPVPLFRLVGRLPIGVVSLDANLRIEYLNPSGRVFLGGGARIGGLLPEPWPHLSLRKFAKRLFSAVPPVKQVTEVASGRLVELDGIAGRRGESALLLIQDVSTRERQRRVERAFVTNAAHELRTPIAAITSTLDVLQGGAKDVPADRDRFLEHLQRESDRLGRLVAALLLLARIQNGQQSPTLDLVEVRPLLDAIGADLQPRAGVRVKVDCADDVGMLADVDLLRQAVWNLAANAATHTAKGEIRLAGRDLGRLSEIEVRDTGPGMSESERAQALERFYRAHNVSGATGFGLGLPIAREIANALGGSLSLDSQQDVGTRVRVQLPSARLVA
jgi:two-component system phosphate regulon sensor histidine kinase PhoR